TFRASGVVNFGHAATGMYIAFAYYELRNTGELVLPLLGLPDRITVVSQTEGAAEIAQPTEVTALVICALLAAAIGALLYFAIFKWLRTAPALGRVIASVGVFIYFIGMADLRFGTRSATTGTIDGPLPSDIITWGSLTNRQDIVLTTLIVVAATVSLAALYRYTRFGLATRAAAENERGAILLGLSPDLIGVINWMMATVLAGMTLILVAERVSLDPTTTSLLIVPALAAALVGSFTSFGITAAAGLAIGMLMTEIFNIQSEWSWLPTDLGLQQGVPFVLILVIMVFRGQSIPDRGAINLRALPFAPRPTHATVAAIAVGAIAMLGLLTLGTDWRGAIIVSGTAAVLSLSVVVITGYVGQISLAQYSFAGISAFMVVRITEGWGIHFPFTPVLAALVAVAAGLVVGIPAVRVRGINLAIATLAAAVAIEELVFKWAWFTGGLVGSNVEAPTLFGWDLSANLAGDFERWEFGLLVVATAVLLFIAVGNMRRSTTGVRWLAVRSNERAAAAAGIAVASTKLQAFGVSSFIAGLGGALIAYSQPTLSTGTFLVVSSLIALAITYLAGITSLSGAALAGVLATGGLLTVALERLSDDSSDYQFALNGLFLIVAAVVYPSGITGAVRDAVGRRRARAAATA
ncbi:MAG: ABC transporter permease, partial [Acidimicrobiia bacterium]|nr:ABC transporter permease [Acidimicrobiia bacterium]